jgi:hypothetical protein
VIERQWRVTQELQNIQDVTKELMREAAKKRRKRSNQRVK